MRVATSCSKGQHRAAHSSSAYRPVSLIMVKCHVPVVVPPPRVVFPPGKVAAPPRGEPSAHGQPHGAVQPTGRWRALTIQLAVHVLNGERMSAERLARLMYCGKETK